MPEAQLDVAAVCADFPALAQHVQGRPLIYLDNAATTQKPRVVLDETQRCYIEYCGNVQRSVHRLAERASLEYEAARSTVQKLLGATSPEEIVFVSGATAAINLVARGFGDEVVGPGDEVIVTELEHHSNLLPWQELCRRRSARLRTVPLDDHGALRLDVYRELLGPRTRLVALAHVSNALGTENPVRELIELAHARGARVLVDGAQAVGRRALDVKALDCDFYAFSGHKLYGPFGIGVLYGKREELERVHPPITGGGMVDVVEAEWASHADLPQRLEAGTPNLAGAVALARAIEYLTQIGWARIEQHDRALVAYARSVLGALPRVRLIGTAEPALGVVSFSVEGVHPHDVATILDQHGIAVRAGHHCAQPVMRHFSLPGTVRASFAVYNTCAEVDALAAALAHVREVLGG